MDSVQLDSQYHQGIQFLLFAKHGGDAPGETRVAIILYSRKQARQLKKAAWRLSRFSSIGI
ncbi:hypothetical protein DSCO28_51310 [Desulfosarcina ovata subsp. sediminis]|uniref:Uncharacterized protein n=1 Tax=Desulfosarcina ovata subsp. sediminis TaxID=885957 RepID=A0A5K7ZWD1_9BACT|nr:hypothetical protein DSCO28_51310 [Desulfosarcina ovata subsp. sediminis]